MKQLLASVCWGLIWFVATIAITGNPVASILVMIVMAFLAFWILALCGVAAQADGEGYYGEHFTPKHR